MSEFKTPKSRRSWMRFGRDIAVQAVGGIVGVGLLALWAYVLTG